MDRQRIQDEVRSIREQAAKGGYQLHPDGDFVDQLIEGILTNRDRYGYEACPCRLATGVREKDLPIVCPCDFRDADLADFDACYCALYVADAFRGDDNPVVPDRWDPDATPETAKAAGPAPAGTFTTVTAQVCQVCGYVALKDEPPRKCPVCGVSHERFAPLKLAVAPPGPD
ncbi:MAG: ferredoxin-thioredoxin reductase catalytic domain-containing protein [Planctomycetota bacterium]